MFLRVMVGFQLTDPERGGKMIAFVVNSKNSILIIEVNNEEVKLTGDSKINLLTKSK